ncbi:MAG: hypothetical protein H7246_02115 [Phycisphaerae bacterium]|nr:hypothetical protein [Saprospiraceae bacterium]
MKKRFFNPVRGFLLQPWATPSGVWRKCEGLVYKQGFPTGKIVLHSSKGIQMPIFRALIFLLCPCLATAQGPLDGYLKGKGVLDLAPSFSFTTARKFEGAGGQTYDETYKGQMLSLFAEYGLSEKFDIVAMAAAVFTPLQSGLQDGGLFVKYRPIQVQLGNAGKLGAIVGTGATIPLSDYEPTTTGALGQKAITIPAKLILQWESPLGLFLNFTSGYHFRLDELKEADVARVRQLRPDYEPIDPQNFTTFLIKAGFPARHFYLDAWAEWQHTSGGADYVENVPDLPQSYGVSYTQVGGTAYYSDNERTGFYCSGGYILHGRNTSRIQRITFGMVVKIG